MRFVVCFVTGARGAGQAGTFGPADDFYNYGMLYANAKVDPGPHQLAFERIGALER